MARCINRSRSYYTRFLFLHASRMPVPNRWRWTVGKQKNREKILRKNTHYRTGGDCRCFKIKTYTGFYKIFQDQITGSYSHGFYIPLPCTVFSVWNIRYLFVSCSLFVRILFVFCSPFVRSLFALCSPFVRWLFAVCSPFVRCLYGQYRRTCGENPKKERTKPGGSYADVRLSCTELFTAIACRAAGSACLVGWYRGYSVFRQPRLPHTGFCLAAGELTTNPFIAPW